MKNYLFITLLFLVSLFLGYYSYSALTASYQLAGIFVSGMFAGLFLMMLKINVKNKKINSYKRELEKESISSDEATARVKVLESKIKVLEKALETALDK